MINSKIIIFLMALSVTTFAIDVMWDVGSPNWDGSTPDIYDDAMDFQFTTYSIMDSCSFNISAINAGFAGTVTRSGVLSGAENKTCSLHLPDADLHAWAGYYVEANAVVGGVDYWAENTTTFGYYSCGIIDINIIMTNDTSDYTCNRAHGFSFSKPDLTLDCWW
jgi:hypothetical protein